MSTVDIATIQEAMKMASLDTLRGYTQSHYGEVRQFSTTEYISQNQALGYQILREPLWNKGKSNPNSQQLS
jgi:malate dehydrogenase (oxaloacetate-decarboxylating)(NADP+)